MDCKDWGTGCGGGTTPVAIETMERAPFECVTITCSIPSPVVYSCWLNVRGCEGGADGEGERTESRTWVVCRGAEELSGKEV